jgi:hypothetical protein
MRVPLGSSKIMARSCGQNSPVIPPKGVTRTLWVWGAATAAVEARVNEAKKTVKNFMDGSGKDLRDGYAGVWDPVMRTSFRAVMKLFLGAWCDRGEKRCGHFFDSLEAVASTLAHHARGESGRREYKSAYWECRYGYRARNASANARMNNQPPARTNARTNAGTDAGTDAGDRGRNRRRNQRRDQRARFWIRSRQGESRVAVYAPRPFNNEIGFMIEPLSMPGPGPDEAARLPPVPPRRAHDIRLNSPRA